MKNHLKAFVHGSKQSGQALISMLVFMAVGAIILTPVLNYIGTGLIVGRVFQDKTDDFYTADAGIVDAQWQLKNDRLSSIFPSPDFYDQYEFGNNPSWGTTIDGTGGWYYPSAVGIYDGNHKVQINNRSVAVQVRNLWVPSNIPIPTATDARNIAESGALVVTGRDTGQFDASGRKFEITVNYVPSGILNVISFGFWLPPGFIDFSDGTHPLQINGSSYAGAIRSQTPNANGTSVLWTLISPTAFTSMPGVGVDDNPITLNITFWYKFKEVVGQESSRLAQAIGWVTTSDPGVYAWDADTHVVALTSKAATTYIDAIVIRQETRQLGASVNGDYYATGNSLLSPTTNQAYRDRFYSSSSAIVTNSNIPANAKVEAVYLYWSGWIDWHGYNPLGAHDTTIFEEICDNFTSPPVSWAAGSRWTINNGRFQGRGQSGSTEAQRTITSSAIPNLGSYAGQTVVLSWTQTGYGIDSNDYLYFKLSNGTTDTGWIEAFHGTNSPTSPFTYTIPLAYLTNTTTISFLISGAAPGYTNTWTSTSDYVYIDNITIELPQIFFDDGSVLPGNWTISSGTWNVFSGHFRGYGGSELTQAVSKNLTPYSGVSLAASFDVFKGTLNSSDRLYISFSGNGGTSWSAASQVFVDMSQTSNYVSFLIPDAYKTANFKMRFSVNGSSSRYVMIDNITISGPSLKYPSNGTAENLENLVSQVAKVDRVAFGTTPGNTQTITADTYQVLPNGYGSVDSNFTGTWSYIAMKDVTNQIDSWVTAGDVLVNGAATYTLGHVIAANTEDPSYSFNFYGGGSTGYPLGTPAASQTGLLPQYSYVGWSMVIIYSSPETKSRQLWLYDIATPGFTFSEAWQTSGNPDPDFDGDGNGGGAISGFLVPEGIELENNSSKITVFVLEGDNGITGDQITVTGQDGTNQALSNASSPSNNVWNSQSPGLSNPGIDIDTFYVNYPLLKPGDTSATINLPTQSDGFLLGYIIISFRSDTTTGGAVSFLIR